MLRIFLPVTAPPTNLVVRELRPADALAFARCLVLDAELFPYPSIPDCPAVGGRTWVASSAVPDAVDGFLASAASSGVRYLHGLAVAPAARRRGIARALLCACVKDARERRLRAIALHVGAGNRPAVDLYTSEGFAVRRVVPNFYRPGVYPVADAFEMVLPLHRPTPERRP